MTEPLAPQRPALRCAASHPYDDLLLCSRLSGHGGIHADDGAEWTTDTEETR